MNEGGVVGKALCERHLTGKCSITLCGPCELVADGFCWQRTLLPRNQKDSWVFCPCCLILLGSGLIS